MLPFGKCWGNFALFLFIFLLSPGKSVGVSSILLGLILVGRAAFVFPLSFLSNLTKNSPYDKINFKQQVWSIRNLAFMVLMLSEKLMYCNVPMAFVLQVTIWWAGLMRGAVSMALAYNQVKYQTVSFSMGCSFGLPRNILWWWWALYFMHAVY